MICYLDVVGDTPDNFIGYAAMASQVHVSLGRRYIPPQRCSICYTHYLHSYPIIYVVDYTTA